MPGKCLFCGEVAVIEESVDGGREQMICIECGSIATGAGEKRSADLFYDDEEITERSVIVDSSADRDADETSSCLCNSCGITLSNKSCKDQLCPDCAELSEEEISQLEKNDDNITVAKKLTQEETERRNSPKCISCQSENLNLDSVHGDERLICTDCGMVNSDTVLTNDAYIPESGVSTKYHVPTLPHFAERQRVHQGLVAGLSKISSLSSKLCFSSLLQTEAEDMFRKVFFHPRVLNVTIVKKEYIAAVCLFVVCRRNDLPISLTHFKPDVGDFSRFLRAKQFVHKILNISLPHMSVTRQLTDVLHSLNFDPGMMTKVKELLFLFRRAWLTQGRSRISLIALAAYYVYSSSDRCKKFITRQQFCTQNKLPKISLKLAMESENFLLKLAQSLPWITTKLITIRFLPLYINDILQYQDSLLHLIFEPEENVNNISQGTLDTSPEKSTNGESYGTKRRPLSVCSRKERLLPSASKRQRLNYDSYVEERIVIPDNVNLDSPDLQEFEFDEEISSYILSNEEQEKMRKDKMSIIQK